MPPLKPLSLLIWVLLLCSALPLHAFELEGIQINGFLSQGYLESSGHNFLTADSSDGTFELFEAGLAFNTQLTDKLHLGMQLLARDFGQQGNNEVRLDWGYGDYRWRDWLGVRAGKIKQPLGLYNQERDSDFLRPMIFLPQSLYYEGRRDTSGAALGGSLYGHLLLGAAGDFAYELFYGDISIPDDSPILSNAEARVNGFFGAAGQVIDLDFRSDSTFSSQLIYSAPLPGLRLSATYSRFRGAYDVEALTFFGPPTRTSFRYQFDIRRSCTGSLEYASPWITLAAEYNQTEVEITFEDLPVPLAPVSAVSESWYLLATVPLPPLPELSLSVLYDVYYPDRDDRDGASRPPGEEYLAWQKDWGVGLRYDLNRHWLVKAEWHEVDGAGLVEEFYNPDGLRKNWHYFAFKTSFNF